MMIVAGDPPDFRTIPDFRKRHLKALAALFVQVFDGAAFAILRECAAHDLAQIEALSDKANNHSGRVVLSHVILNARRSRCVSSIFQGRKRSLMTQQRIRLLATWLVATQTGFLKQPTEMDIPNLYRPNEMLRAGIACSRFGG
jgi:hypothetical protein